MSKATSSNVRRNDPCPCGSGKKFKSCCLRARAAAVADSAPAAAAPDDRALLEEAIRQHKAGHIEHANNLYMQVLALKPHSSIALYGLGRINAQSGQTAEAVRLLRLAIKADSRTPEYLVTLANVLMESGDPQEAIRWAERAQRVDPRHAPGFAIAAAICERQNRTAKALEYAKRALALGPDNTNARILLARLERRQGDSSSAKTLLQKVIADERNPDQRARALNELGFVLDRLGEFPEAFDCFHRGNTLLADSPAVGRLDAGLWSRRIARYRSDLDRSLLHKWGDAPPADDLPRPTFLVGFPRSGTTLTERVLAAHPAVVSTDEQPFVLRLKRALGRMFGQDVPESDVPAMLRDLDREQALKLRRSYWNTVTSEFGEDLTGKVFMDKMPLNIIEAGLISVLFPEARLLVALRDPRDVCLSCFMQWFNLNTAMIRFLHWEDTASFYAEVMDLWLHLREALATPFLEFRYEDTVVDLEHQSRRILGFLGVDWDARVLSFHEDAQKRYVSTPSFVAVTEPVHTRAVGRWRNYEEQVAIVAPTLRPFCKAFGYDEC